ncbi:hypothetical protein BTM25_44780 [Actinomadura rubteroloni]|uniref:Uncharacterized protein n=1 Tax=Actinomadura rubteroloni TaxID=1926885 RepID=A0A2P4UE52_9ACTN|nr:hypothetical protein [Actinomadura rubteroloni]POM23325.1 hypothetical protein BTM25_44780 [Actinomadura rubteroloni]
MDDTRQYLDEVIDTARDISDDLWDVVDRAVEGRYGWSRRPGARQRQEHDRGGYGRDRYHEDRVQPGEPEETIARLRKLQEETEALAVELGRLTGRPGSQPGPAEGSSAAQESSTDKTST